MTIDSMKERKKELGYTDAQIAKLAGVPLETVRDIFNGNTASPGYGILQALEQALNQPEDMYVREPQTAYAPSTPRQQGEFTLEDYYEIPDDIRVELIDGVIYNMTAPTSAHQLIAGYIYAKLLFYISGKKGSCLPMISPLDVQLDCDNRTMVQPDVIIVCDRDKVINRCVYGAPDFVIEVLSKSTKKKDSFIKLNKYQNAGVREYWMIDPQKLKVIVYDFEQDNYPVVYGFEDKVPVRILGKDCVIDFKEVYEHIRFLYDRDARNQ